MEVRPSTSGGSEVAEAPGAGEPSLSVRLEPEHAARALAAESDFRALLIMKCERIEEFGMHETLSFES